MRDCGITWQEGQLILILGAAACLRWNGWVEVVFAVPVDLPGSDFIRVASWQDAFRELVC
jgi:hypothetical protein